MTKRSISALLICAAIPVLALAGGVTSGVKVGGNLAAFEPTHVSGPDKGTETCPVCKYGMQPAAQVWVNTDDLDNVGKIAATLEGEIAKYGAPKFRAFVVFIPRGDAKDLSAKLAKLATDYKLKNVALTYVKGPKDEPITNYEINTSADTKNTVLVYKDRKVTANMVNLKADKEGLAALVHAIDKTVK